MTGPAEIDGARYIALTTFKRDGSPVSSPVWVTGRDGSYAFTTGAESWKVRRLSRNPDVEVRVCDMRGRVAPTAVRHAGTGEVDRSPAAVEAVGRVLATKYGWQYRVLTLIEAVRARTGRGGPSDRVAVRLTLTA